MVPTASEITLARWRMAAWLRILGGVSLLLAFPALVSWMVEGMRDSDVWDYYYYSGRMSVGLGGLFVGPVLILFAPSLTRLLLPVPPATLCPRCRYPIAGVSEPRCPECGLAVDGVYLATAASEQNDAWRRRRTPLRILDEMTPAATLLGCVWTMLVAGAAVLAMTAAMGFVGGLIAAMLAAPIVLSQLLGLRLAVRGGRLRRRAPEAAPSGSTGPSGSPAPAAASMPEGAPS